MGFNQLLDVFYVSGGHYGRAAVFQAEGVFGTGTMVKYDEDVHKQDGMYSEDLTKGAIKYWCMDLPL